MDFINRESSTLLYWLGMRDEPYAYTDPSLYDALKGYWKPLVRYIHTAVPFSLWPQEDLVRLGALWRGQWVTGDQRLPRLLLHWLDGWEQVPLKVRLHLDRFLSYRRPFVLTGISTLHEHLGEGVMCPDAVGQSIVLTGNFAYFVYVYGDAVPDGAKLRAGLRAWVEEML